LTLTRVFTLNKKYDIITDKFIKMTNAIRQNINFIKENIKSVTGEFHNVEIVVVTKTFPCEYVSLALECGIKHIGESKIQEALPKFERLGGALEGVTKHFIGHLQSNKAKKAVLNFDLIDSLDSLDLAYDISRHAKEAGKIQDCLIEVKISDEESKTGICADLAGDFYSKCLLIENIAVKGLMAITPYGLSAEESRVYFREVYGLFKDFRKYGNNAGFSILSMGMSGDYKAAIEEGSNMVRIGSAIFGERDYGNKQ
jgi:pyridoxal phosphate enzyme (YggS family)